jgi:hypothetical protein
VTGQDVFLTEDIPINLRKIEFNTNYILNDKARAIDNKKIHNFEGINDTFVEYDADTILIERKVKKN